MNPTNEQIWEEVSGNYGEKHTHNHIYWTFVTAHFGWGGQKMSDWNSMRSDNQCNSLQNNAIHHRFGFQRQLLSLHSTGNPILFCRFLFTIINFTVPFLFISSVVYRLFQHMCGCVCWFWHWNPQPRALSLHQSFISKFQFELLMLFLFPPGLCWTIITALWSAQCWSFQTNHRRRNRSLYCGTSKFTGNYSP